MRFGKNIKIASLLNYRDQSLIFVKYVVLDKNYELIFDDEKYVIYEDMLLNDVAKEADKNNIERLYLISNSDHLLNLYPYMIYSDSDIRNRIDKLNNKAKVKVK